MLEIEEIPSPVYHYERSLPNEKGELVGGRLWAELDVDDSPGSAHRQAGGAQGDLRGGEPVLPEVLAPQRPQGLVGRADGRGAVKGGRLVLREPGHKGRTYGVWR